MFRLTFTFGHTVLDCDEDPAKFLIPFLIKCHYATCKILHAAIVYFDQLSSGNFVLILDIFSDFSVEIKKSLKTVFLATH